MQDIPDYPSNTIGSTLYGGLGNKLFQAAVLYAFSQDYSKNLVILNHAINPHSRDGYETTFMKHFLPNTKLAPYFIPGKDYLYSIGLSDEYIDLCHKKHYPSSNEYFVCEDERAKQIVHHPILTTKMSGYIAGLFQYPEFFNHRRDEILNLFKPTEEIEHYLKEKYAFLDKAIALHIRIPDDDQYKQNEGRDNYYLSSLDKLKDMIGEEYSSLHFYIFCNRNIDDATNIPYIQTLPSYTIVQDNEVNCLYLMSMCRRGCINQNSTFSWWGNYLNTNPDKIFISQMDI